MFRSIRVTVLAGLATFAAADVGRAAVFVSSSPTGFDLPPAPGETLTIDFNAGLPGGVTLTPGAGIVSGTSPGLYSAPAGDETPYLSTPITGGAGSAELSFAPFLSNRDVTHFSLYWGSIDGYNTLQLLDRAGKSTYAIAGGAITGSNFAGSASDPAFNRRVYFSLTGSDQNLGGLRFTSTPSPAFEVDNLSFATVPGSFAAVPEPTSWMMLIAGFALSGAMVRRQRRVAKIVPTLVS